MVSGFLVPLLLQEKLHLVPCLHCQSTLSSRMKVSYVFDVEGEIVQEDVMLNYRVDFVALTVIIVFRLTSFNLGCGHVKCSSEK